MIWWIAHDIVGMGITVAYLTFPVWGAIYLTPILIKLITRG